MTGRKTGGGGWGEIERQARKEADERRARVLKHPDLKDRLTQAPLGYKQPEQWNGYVPPKTVPSSGWDHILNDSPQRTALVEISSEALRREQAQPESKEEAS